MTEDIKTLVALKYPRITRSTSSEDLELLLEQYPTQVRVNWVWRCVEDAEHLAKGHAASEETIRLVKLYREEKASEQDLDKSCILLFNHNINGIVLDGPGACAAYAYRVAAATPTINSATYAVAYAVAAHTRNVPSDQESLKAQAAKWAEYFEWLFEETCKWEENQ